MFIIFLDIDGVLFEGFDSCSHSEEYNDLFEQYIKDKPNYSQYVYEGILTDYAQFKAQTHFFDELALSNLKKLMDYVKQKGIDVGIVLSSAWREFFDTETLKKLFSRLEFSQYIVDKTYDDAYLEFSGEAECEFNRAELIELWLKQHPKVSQFIILDDVDFNFKELFPEHFVPCKNLYGTDEFAFSLTVIDKVIEQHIDYGGIQNKVIPKVVKNFDGNRECNQSMQEVSMRVLLSTRLSFLESRLRYDSDSPFKNKNNSITKLILEYEDGDQKFWKLRCNVK